MKDLGYLNYFLRLEVLFGSTGYYLSQVKYVIDFLSCVNLLNNKIVSTSLEAKVKPSPTEKMVLNDPTLDKQLVRNFIYLTVT